MTAEIISGKELAQELRENMKHEAKALNQAGVSPHLTVILVGNNPASRSYVSGKQKASKEIGIESEVIELPETVSEDALLDQIVKLNTNQRVHGILVQLPLPDHIDEQKVIEAIDPAKDVDGFHPISIGK